jgi:hypothetical protein
MAVQKNIIGLWMKNIPKKIKIPLERQELPYEKNTTSYVSRLDDIFTDSMRRQSTVRQYGSSCG